MAKQKETETVIEEPLEAQAPSGNGTAPMYTPPKRRPDARINDNLKLDLNRLTRRDMREVMALKPGTDNIPDRTDPFLAKALDISAEELEDLGGEDYLNAFNKFWDTVNWLMNSQKN